jgi:WD40 repeat protein
MDRKSPNSQSQNSTVPLSDGDNIFNFSPTTIIDGSDREIKHKPLMATSPYKGLKPFTAEEREYFLGRDELILRLLKDLCKKNLILLLGSSGSGKSSSIQAGLIPQIRENLVANFTEIICKPDRNPFLSLSNAFLEKNCDRKEAEILLQEEVNALTNLAQALQLKNDRSYWLIFIDDFEELFTISEPKKSQRFIDALIHLYNYLNASSDKTVKFKIILAMRTYFLDRLSANPRLADITFAQNNTQAIANMNPYDLRLAIKQPAARHGVVFEEALVEKILQDVQEQTNFLPLLQYTLDLLWQSEDLNQRTLKLSTYQQLGGIQAALNNQSNQLYNSLLTTEQVTTKRIFLQLVKFVEPQKSGLFPIAVCQRKKLSEFNEQLSKAMINKLIDNHLLISDRSTETLEIVHEVFLSAWKTLKDWIEEASQAIALKKQLTEAVKSWQMLGQEDPERAIIKLWQGSKLEKACELRDTQIFDLVVGELRDEENRFLEESIAWQNRLLRVKEKQIQELNRSLAEAKLREQAARIQNILPVRPLEGLLLAIQTMGENLEKLPQQILPGVQTSLNRAMEIAKEQNVLQGHEDRVNAVALSPDGQIIASGSWDRTVRLWDRYGNSIGQPFRGHEGDVTSVAFSPDGEAIASGGGDGTVRLWDLQGNSIAQPFRGHEGDVTSVAFSPDGEAIASGGGDGTVRLWDWQGNSIAQPFRGHEGDVTSVAFSPDGEAIASGGGDGTVRLWDWQGNSITQPFRGHEDKVATIAFSRDGQAIASGSWDTTVRLWDLQGKAMGRPFRGHEDYVIAIAFDPKGKYIVSSSSDKTIRLWDRQGNSIGQPLRGHKSSVRSVVFSRDGQMLVSGSTDKTVRLWDLQGNAIAQPFKGHDVSLWSVAFSRDGQTMASGGGDGTVRLWERQGNPIGEPFRGHAGEVTSVTFSPDGQIIASGSWDKTVRLWNLYGNPIAQPFVGHENDVTSVVFSPDGQIIASGSWDKTVRLWDLYGNSIAQPFVGHEGDVTSVAFSPEGQIIASGSWDKTIRLWDLQGNSIAQPFVGHQERVNSVAFSPDGQIIVSGGGDGTVRLWDRQGNPIGQPFVGHDNYVTSVAFSPDGQTIVSGGGDGTVRLWDRQGNPIAQPFEIQKSEITSVAFSPDGQIIVSGSLNGTIYLWRGGGWRSALQVCCNRLRYHPACQNPQTDWEREACRVCQKHFWHREASEWNKQGAIKLEEQAFQAALEDFNRAIEIDRNHTGALYNRARTYINLGDSQKAIEDLNQLIETMPTHATAYFYRGQCYAELGDRLTAIEDCQQAAALYQQQGQNTNYAKAIAYLHQLQR